MKKIMIVMAVAMVLAGCQTRITAEKNPEQVVVLQEKVTVNGEEQLITTGVVVASGGWYATARSPLWATETLKGLVIGVETNGTVRLELGDYSRDLSTNSVVMVDNLLTGSAKLIEQIGVTYAKMAGGGAQAETASSFAAKLYQAFTAAGGDATKATVTSDTTAKTVTVSDGNISTTSSGI